MRPAHQHARASIVIVVLSLGLLALLIGCGGDEGTQPGAPVGSVVVSVDPDSIVVAWLITGPESFEFHGTGDDTLARVPAGAYTITWPEVAGRVTPTPNPQSRLLGAGDTILFTGTYAGIGSVLVDIVPDEVTATWQLDGPGGYRQVRSGDYSEAGAAEGDYTLTWGQQLGYRTPSPGSLTRRLGGGGAIAFFGQYTPIASLSIDTDPDAIGAPWTVTGLSGPLASGLGDSILSEIVAGSYSVRFLHKAGWLDPSPNPVLVSLTAGDFKTVTGIYAQAASLVLEPEPFGIRAPWRVEGPNGFVRTGSGSSTLADIAPGTYFASWLEYGGWAPPPVTPLEYHLVAGAHAVSTWRYEWTGLVPLPGGTFTMGSPYSEPDRQADEQQHEVTLTRALRISAVEVTQDQWRLIMGSNPSSYDCGSCPVHNVSWRQAVEFCNLLSDAHGYQRAYQQSGDAVTWNQSANGYSRLLKSPLHALVVGPSEVYRAS